MDVHSPDPDLDGSTTVLLRLDALRALLALYDCIRYGPRGEEPTQEHRDRGIGTYLSASHLADLDRLTDAADSHERHVRLVANGETPTGICAQCARYAAITEPLISCEGR